MGKTDYKNEQNELEVLLLHCEDRESSRKKDLKEFTKELAMKLESNRLLLKSLSIDNLIELNTEARIINESIILDNFKITDAQKRAIDIKTSKMKLVNKEFHDWYTYWIIVNKDNFEAMGFIGFKGINLDGEAEVGYSIIKSFEGKGYMTESIKSLINWAFQNKKCNVITATRVLKSNIGSQKVLLNTGFEKSSENEEAIDYKLLKKNYKAEF